jgi:very-short-patch-repair endonuclease
MRAIAAARPTSYYEAWINAAHVPEAVTKNAASRLGGTRSEEFRARMREASRDNTSHLGFQHSPETKDLLRLATLRGRLKQANNKEPTNIERIVYDYLDNQNIVFEKQKSIGSGFIVDAYIPSLNLVVEADGSYWHSTERGLKTDLRKNTYIKEQGLDLLRLSEAEIKNGSFIERLGGIEEIA